MEYLGSVASALFTTLFIAFLIGTLGYLIGAIKIKGISLGTAGVLLVAIVAGVIFASLLVDGKLIWEIGGKSIKIWDDSVKSTYSFISNIGTAMFVGAVGLIAGPTFFRNFNKSMISYLLMGVIVIVSGVALTIAISAIDQNMDIAMGTGLLTGALTSTPGLSAAKEAALQISEEAANKVTAGYGIGYLYGVLGVVIFVQIMPKILKVDIEKERESFQAANRITLKEDTKKRVVVDPLGIFPLFFVVVFGLLIGCVKIPISATSYFSFGSSGGALIAGLIIGHFGHVGPIDLKISKSALNFFRELGLVLFLIGAGVPGGINFVKYFNPLYLLYGVIFTTVPLIVGFFVAKYVFKLSIFNNLGSITGGMTSTPALGSLISVAGTDDVASSYAATYPIALVLIVVAANLMVTVLGPMI